MSNLLTDKILEALKPVPGCNLVITAGNSFRMDDGVGPYIYSILFPLNLVHIIDAGYTPENTIEDAVSLKPDKIIFIDAADFGGKPGEVRIIPEESIPEVTMSTHMIPLNVVSKLIVEDTGSHVVFIGIQPENVGMGEGICDEVKLAADSIVDEIKKYYEK